MPNLFSVQCQICYKFEHGAPFCYHKLEENYVPTLPPPVLLAPAQTQTATAQTVQWTPSVLALQQVQEV